MDLTQIKEVTSWIGDKSSLVTQWVITKFSEFGVNITQTQSKILNLILLGLILLLIIKVIEIPKKAIKWGVIILIILLGISTIISFI